MRTLTGIVIGKIKAALVVIFFVCPFGPDDVMLIVVNHTIPLLTNIHHSSLPKYPNKMQPKASDNYAFFSCIIH